MPNGAARAGAGGDPPRGHRHACPGCWRLLRGAARRCLLFCDDLSFDQDDASYKSLKAVLEGGIEGRPDNVVFYATSNRRHLLSRDMIENERSTAINPGEAVEEKVSLSDRFGLWLGFHACDQETYLAMVRGYAERYGLELPQEQVARRGAEWAITRGARSGRVAWQYIQDLAGRLGKADSEAPTSNRAPLLQRRARTRSCSAGVAGVPIERARAVADLEMQLRLADRAGGAAPARSSARAAPSRRASPAAPRLCA